MPAPRSVRFDEPTEERLLGFASRRPGLTRSAAAALLVDEGLRMDAHPLIFFREGPAGRRAVLIGGPDVWEVIRALQLTRAAESKLTSRELVELVAENTGLAAELLEAAIDYYAQFPEELDLQIADSMRAEREAEDAWERRRDLLGA